MEVKSASRRTDMKNRAICSYWLAGRCNRNPCRFLHGEGSRQQGFRPSVQRQSRSLTWKNPQYSAKIASIPKGRDCVAVNETNATSQKPSSKRVCKYWIQGHCKDGKGCPHMHSWFYGDEFSTVANLQGHTKAITGIVLPDRTEKLFSGSSDGTVMIWDCHTGQCANIINVEGEVGSLFTEGPWVFVGLPNLIKAWNTQTNAEFTLSGPRGLVLSMAVANNMLFAGDKEGTISVWGGGPDEAHPFQMVASLRGHTKDVVCLTLGGKMLYSGSMDHTIRGWDIETLQCTMTLTGHTNVVTSLICWDQFLISSSLDCTLNIWAGTAAGPLEVIYTHKEEHGVLGLCGMSVEDSKDILFCSCNDDSVHLYELPSFADKGRLFSKQEFSSLATGPGGLFFTGDGSGNLKVWNWPTVQKDVAADGTKSLCS